LFSASGFWTAQKAFLRQSKKNGAAHERPFQVLIAILEMLKQQAVYLQSATWIILCPSCFRSLERHLLALLVLVTMRRFPPILPALRPTAEITRDMSESETFGALASRSAVRVEQRTILKAA